MLFSASLFSENKGYIEPWGKGKELALQAPSQMKPQPRSLPTRLAELIILFHQRILSPTDGPRSHYYPSSSEFMKQAIQKHGFMMGYVMGCDRLLRENKDPWVYRTTTRWNADYKFDPVRQKP